VKTRVAVLVFVFSASGALAQQQAAAPVKMECRDISASGNVVYSNETLVNGMACHVVDAKQIAQTPTAPVKSPATAIPPSADQSLAGGQPNPNVAAPVSSPAPMVTPATGLVNTHIISGATVYVEPMEGFENYIAAAFQKKGVPLVPVASREQATYILKGTAEEKKPGWAKIAFTGQIHSDDAASVQMIDRASGVIVFAYAVNKKNTLHGEQTTAEACAKHLKEQIEKK
jgi:hypothetical protein